MKEFLFTIDNMDSNNFKVIKILANDIKEAKNKFTKAFMPFMSYSYEDLYYFLENQNVRIKCVEFKDIILV